MCLEMGSPPWLEEGVGATFVAHALTQHPSGGIFNLQAPCTTVLKDICLAPVSADCPSDYALIYSTALKRQSPD
jgi:hypothetical protein